MPTTTDISPGRERELILSTAREAEEKALAWLSARLDYFNPLRTGDMRRFKLTVKPLAELALTCAIASVSRGVQASGVTQNRP